VTETGEQAPQVWFGVLGPLEVWARDARVALAGTRQEQVLAVLLLEAGRVVPVTRLIEACWDTQPPDTAAHQIRKAVSDLRKRLPAGPALLRTEGAGYRAVVAPSQLDLLRFEELTSAEPDAERLEAALALWRGLVLGGGGGRIIEGAAVALHERRLAAVELLADLRLARGESAALVGELRTLTQAYPYRESLRTRLMLALYRAGRQAEALEEFDRARQLLREELGSDPDPSLARLHESILRGDPELASAEPVVWPLAPRHAVAPSTLPHDLPDFVGRKAEMAQIWAAATRPTVGAPRIVTIDAMGGTGKTALALHAAHRLGDRFPDGRLYIDLHGFTPDGEPTRPEAALDALLRSLGVSSDQIPNDQAGRTALWRTTTADLSLLLLLDNAAEAAQLRPLLPASAGCLVLVTSRVRLLDLDGAEAVALGVLSEEDCALLIEQAVGGDRAAADPAAVAELIGLCGRLPLALRIAAARLRARPGWNVRHLVERLADDRRRLDELRTADRGVTATLYSSYQALDFRYKRAFRTLGRHPGTDLDAFAAAALLGTAPAEADEILEGLIDSCLLDEQEPGHYAFHDLVRAFARGLPAPVPAADPDTDTPAAAGADPEADRRALERLLDYYVATVEEACDLLFPARTKNPFPLRGPVTTPGLSTCPSAMSWFARELRNLMAAIHAASNARLLRHAAYLPHGVGAHLHAQGYSAELLEAGQIAVAAARELDDPVLSRISLIDLTVGYWHAGRLQEAADTLRTAYDYAEALDDGATKGVYLGHLAVFQTSLGHNEEALNYLKRSMALHEASGDTRQQGHDSIARSDVLTALERYSEAADAASRAVELGSALGEPDQTAAALHSLARAYNGMGRHQEAMSCLTEADGIYHRFLRPVDAIIVRARIAETFLMMGEPGAARRSADALLSSWDPGIPAIRQAAVSNILGRVFAATGNRDAALERYLSAQRQALRIGLHAEVNRAQAGLAALG
jgi:DNA-binding SARP family transcriptional activator